MNITKSEIRIKWETWGGFNDSNKSEEKNDDLNHNNLVEGADAFNQRYFQSIKIINCFRQFIIKIQFDLVNKLVFVVGVVISIEIIKKYPFK